MVLSFLTRTKMGGLKNEGYMAVVVRFYDGKNEGDTRNYV